MMPVMTSAPRRGEWRGGNVQALPRRASCRAIDPKGGRPTRRMDLSCSVESAGISEQSILRRRDVFATAHPPYRIGLRNGTAPLQDVDHGIHHLDVISAARDTAGRRGVSETASPRGRR